MASQQLAPAPGRDSSDRQGQNHRPTAQSSVADPDPDPPDPHVFGPPGSGPLVRGMDPDPSIIMQK
jgi:hypothetical protein